MLTPALPLPVDAVQLHLAMLDDRDRTAAYLDAIRDSVREGDVVVDIGTDTGVLAAAAAQAGARRVYAIEVGGIRRSARRLFEENGLAERIVVVPRWSFRTRLAQRADVVVSELIGNEPLAEGVVPVSRDAKLRFLKPGGQLIPSTLAFYAVPLEIPDAPLERLTFRPATLGRWKQWYGIDFSALAAVSEPPIFRHFIKPQDMRPWPAMAAPIPVADIELGRPRRPWIRSSQTTVAERSGRLNAVVVYFELTAGNGVFLSTSPQRTADSGHWESPVQLLDEPVDVRQGDRIDLTYWNDFRSALSGCRVVNRS